MLQLKAPLQATGRRTETGWLSWNPAWIGRSPAAEPRAVALVRHCFPLVLSVSHERSHDGVQSLGKRDLNTGIQLLEAFSSSPLELRHGEVGSPTKPPSWPLVFPSLEHILLSIFPQKDLFFIFLLVPKYVYNRHYAFGT